MGTRIKRSLRIIALVGLALLPARECLAEDYELQIDNRAPSSGSVRLILDRPLQSDTAFVTRQSGDAHVQAPFCENSRQELTRADTAWTAHKGCSTISWATTFEAASRPIFNVSAQINLYHSEGRWLFSEWGNILRSDSADRPSEICAKLQGIETCRRVPTIDEAPLLMLIGEPRETIVIGQSTVRFFSGHLPGSFKIARLFRSYEGQFSYLYSIAGKKLGMSPPRIIDVLVLGIDYAEGVTGGAAGSSSLLANVVITDGQVNSSERAKLLWISGHELAHVLGLGTEVLWASESLAHYYGFKSAERSDAISALFKQMMEDTEKMGLLETNQRVTQGEGQHYNLFYSKGAAFWKELDDIISAATGGDYSLDNFLPLLINGEFGKNGELPSEFLESVGNVVKSDRIAQVLQEYL